MKALMKFSIRTSRGVSSGGIVERRAEKEPENPQEKASFQDQRFGYFAARSRKPVCVRGRALCMCMCVGIISS